ncbi:MAG: hypothetical protein HC934_10285 [Acaryochloridaceae cyanobacterium SU_2_1]|nr:hypothetical protein [Acaryochloridaceae cyanobacterium SU_2_1]
MESSNFQSVAQNFQQIKTESGTRVDRIRTIWQSAFSQVSQEFKAGYATVRPLATELSSTVVEELKHKTSQTSSQMRDAWQEESKESNNWRRWRRVISVMGTTLTKVVGPPLKQQVHRVDTNFTEWYGNPIKG